MSNSWRQSSIAARAQSPHLPQPGSIAPSPLVQHPMVQQLLSLLTAPPSSLPNGEPAAQVLALTLNGLTDGDFQTRWEVAKLLPQMVSAGLVLPRSAIEALLDLVQEDTDEELSWFALRILGQFEHPDVVPVLVQALQAADSDELKAVTVAAIANQGKGAIEALSRLLDQPAYRLLAVQALSQIRRTETIAPLLGVVQDPDKAVRAAAVEALSSFHDARVPPVLLAALSDPAAAVRQEAAIGLGLRLDLAEALDLAARLRPLLWDLDLGVCRQTAIALGRLGSGTAALAEVLCAPQTPLPLQVEVVRALGWVGSAAALAALEQRIQRSAAPTPEEAAVLREIAAELGRVEAPALQPQAAQRLGRLLSNPIACQLPELKQTVALSLGQLRQAESIDPLLHLLADVDRGVQLHAIAALKQIDAAAAYDRLTELAADPQLAADRQQQFAVALAEWRVDFPA